MLLTKPERRFKISKINCTKNVDKQSLKKNIYIFLKLWLLLLLITYFWSLIRDTVRFVEIHGCADPFTIYT